MLYCPIYVANIVLFKPIIIDLFMLVTMLWYEVSNVVNRDGQNHHILMILK